jgi:hypothetical protein
MIFRFSNIAEPCAQSLLQAAEIGWLALLPAMSKPDSQLQRFLP